MTIPLRLEQLTPDEREFNEWKRKQGITSDDAEFQEWKAKNTPRVQPDVSRALPRNRPDASGDLEVIGRAVAANALNAAQGIPGMEAFEAKMGQLGSKLTDNPLTYEQSLAALRGQTESIPGFISAPEKILVGGRVLGSMLPKSPTTVAGAAKVGAATGAGLGAADAILQADPNVTASQRARQAALNAVVGGATGGTLGAGAAKYDDIQRIRRVERQVREAPTIGAQAVERTNKLSDTQAKDFGLAEAQAAAHETSPGLQKALQEPAVKNYADQLRQLDEFKNANDGEIAMEVHNLLSADRSSLIKGIKNGQLKGEPVGALMIQERQLGKTLSRLKDAIGSPSTKPPLTLDVPENIVFEGGAHDKPYLPETEPKRIEGPENIFGLPTHTDVPGVSIKTPGMKVQTAPAEEVGPVAEAFPRAKAASHELRTQNKHFDSGYQDGLRLLNAARPKNLAEAAQRSPEAFAQKISTMPPDQADQYAQGVLAAAKTLKVPLPGAHETVLGVVGKHAKPIMQRQRLAPALDMLATQRGQPVQSTNVRDVLKILGYANAPVANP